MDRKTAATGDRDEPLQNSGPNIPETSITEFSPEEKEAYIGAILFRLESLTSRNLTEDELAVWKLELMKYPVGRLKVLEAYHGPLNHKIFEELDKGEPEAHTRHPMLDALPEPETPMAKQCCKYIPLVTSDEPLEKRREVRRKFNEKMRKKYPQYTWN